MPNCDMCGAEGELFRAIIEDAEMRVCQKCSKYGKVLGRIRIDQEQKASDVKAERPVKKNTVQIIVSDYAKRIKDAREKLNLKQEDLAKQLSEKESIIHKIETAHIIPSPEFAKKLEKFLKIRLLEEVKEEYIIINPKKDEFTLGDFVKIKNRK